MQFGRLCRRPERMEAMRSYLRFSGTLFVLIALVHLLRLVYRVPAEVGQWALAPWAFRLARGVRPGAA
jgi:hypothetical protein